MAPTLTHPSALPAEPRYQRQVAANRYPLAIGWAWLVAAGKAVTEVSRSTGACVLWAATSPSEPSRRPLSSATKAASWLSALARASSAADACANATAGPPLPAPQPQAARTAGQLCGCNGSQRCQLQGRCVFSCRTATAAKDSELICVRLLRLVKHAERTGLRRVPGISARAAVPHALHRRAVCGSGARKVWRSGGPACHQHARAVRSRFTQRWRPQQLRLQRAAIADLFKALGGGWIK